MFESLKATAYPVANGTEIEAQPSELARGAALLRALAAAEEREEIRGHDYLAEIFLADNRKGALQDPAIREWLIKNYLPFGVYAYSIARTAYFDHVVEQSLRDNIPQIVILGAGYDSRPYRFSSLIKETRIFELDVYITQERKKDLLRQANIPVPGHLTYVPVRDDKDTLKDILLNAGFDNSKLSLFVCEGISYYMTATEVEEIFNFIKLNSTSGSTVCLDYNSLSSEMPDTGFNEIKDAMGSASAAEPARFGIEKGKEGVFLAERELMSLEHLTAEELEKRFLTLRDGTSAGKVPAQYCVVYASLSG